MVDDVELAAVEPEDVGGVPLVTPEPVPLPSIQIVGPAPAGG